MLEGFKPIIVFILVSLVPFAASAGEPDVVTIPRTVEDAGSSQGSSSEEASGEAEEASSESDFDQLVSELSDEELEAMLVAAELTSKARQTTSEIAANSDAEPSKIADAEVEPAGALEPVEEDVEAKVDAKVEVAEREEPEAETAKPIFEIPDTPETSALLESVKVKALASLESISRIKSVFRAPEIDPDNYLVLKPHLDDPRWFDAMTLLVDDKCVEARKKAEEVVGPTEKLGEEADPAVRYALARIDLCAGEATRGRKVLNELAKGEDAVADLARLRLGLRVDRSDEKTRYVSDYLREAAERGRKGEVDEALADLDKLHRELPGRWDKFRARRAQAEILERAGRLDDAGQVYLALYRKTRGWKANSDIEDRIERLERKSDTKILTYGERIDRMRHLISRGRYGDARRVSIENAKLRGVSGNEIRGWSFYRRALQAEKKKDRKEAVELFEKAEKLVKDEEVRPRLYFGWARALRRLDQDRKAIELYGRLCEEFSKHHLCDDARYEAGRLLQFLDDHEGALAKFDAVLSKHNDSDWIADALWRSAFSHILREEWDAAIVNLERLRDDYGDEQDASELSLGLKATYWIGVSHLKAGRTSQARLVLQETINRGKLTWYGRLAVARLEDAGLPHTVYLPESKLTEADTRSLSGILVPVDPRMERAAEFARLGLWDDAEDEVKKLLGAHPVPEGAPRFLAALRLAKGDPARAHWGMKAHIEEAGPTLYTLRDWGTAFPINYIDLAHRFGKKYGVSPFLVQAIIRQESGFRPHVRSWAGAVGLMQLMPGTARYTANKFLEDTRYSRRHLTRPETNIKLGTMYIRLHTAHTSDSVPLALAGYNAGPAPLKSWLDRYGDRELDAWVESITYREARGYVRKVFTSYTVYSHLYGGELPDLELEVPKKLRDWGDIPEVPDEDEPTS